MQAPGGRKGLPRLTLADKLFTCPKARVPEVEGWGWEGRVGRGGRDGGGK